MRRWVPKRQKLMVLVTGCVLLSALMIGAVASSQTGPAVDPRELADEFSFRGALYAGVPLAQRPDGTRLTVKSRERLRRSAAHIPDERRIAHFFFPQGLSSVKVEAFFKRARLDTFEVAVALTTPKGPQLLSVQDHTIARDSGKLAARIDAAVRQRLRDHRALSSSTPENAPFVVIELGVIGSVAELAKLANSRGDFALAYHPSARRAGAVDSRRICYQREDPNSCEPHIQDVPAESRPPLPNAAARQCLSRFLRVTNPDAISDKLADSARELETRAKLAPRERRSAQVFLKAGADSWYVQSLLGLRKIELVAMEVSVPVPNAKDRFINLTFHPAALEIGESIEERIDTAWGKDRAAARRLAKDAQPMTEHVAVANSDDRVVIRLEVIGTREWLNSLYHDQMVYGVFVDEKRVVPQRADVDDPRPEHRMKRLPIPGGSAGIAEVRQISPRSQGYTEVLRRQAAERPQERRIAALMLASDMDPEDVERLLAASRLRFLNHRPAVVIAGAKQPFNLSQAALARQSGGLGQQLQGAALEGRDIDEGEPVRVLMLGVEGELADLAKLAGDSRVYAVMLDQVDL